MLTITCHRKAIEGYIADVIKDTKMPIDEKVYRVMNAKKIIKKYVKQENKKRNVK